MKCKIWHDMHEKIYRKKRTLKKWKKREIVARFSIKEGKRWGCSEQYIFDINKVIKVTLTRLCDILRFLPLKR